MAVHTQTILEVANPAYIPAPTDLYPLTDLAGAIDASVNAAQMVATTLFYTTKLFGATGDGVTDDTVNLQAAIDAVPAYGSLRVQASTYIVTRQDPTGDGVCLNALKPISIFFEAGSSFRLADGDVSITTESVIVLRVLSSDVHITGFGILDGNRDGQSDTSRSTGKRAVLLVDGAIDNVHVRDVSCINGHFQSIAFDGAGVFNRQSDVSCIGAKVVNCREGIAFHWVDRYIAALNNLSGYSLTEAQDAMESSGCTQGVFIGNIINGFGASAYDIGNLSRFISISGGTVKDCGNGLSVGHNSTLETIAGTVTSTNIDLIDSAAPFSPLAHYNFRVKNLTDGSEGFAEQNNTTTNIIVELFGGINNTWTIGDSYIIDLISSDITCTGVVFDGLTTTNVAAFFINPNVGADRVTFDSNIVRNVSGANQHGVDLKIGRGHKVTNNIFENITGSGAIGAVLRLVQDSDLSGNGFINTTSSGILAQAGADNNTINDNKLAKIGGTEILINSGATENELNNNKLRDGLIDDSGTSSLIINSTALALDATGATTPQHHNNLINGAWVA